MHFAVRLHEVAVHALGGQERERAVIEHRVNDDGADNVRRAVVGRLAHSAARVQHHAIFCAGQRFTKQFPRASRLAPPRRG